MALDELFVQDVFRPITERNGVMSEPFQLWMLLVVEYIKLMGGNTVEEDTVLLDDDEEISLQAGKSGYGFCQIGDNQEYSQFSWTSAGAVTLILNSVNVVNTDTDTKLCIYDAGANVNIKNRLGSELSLRYSAKYN